MLEILETAIDMANEALSDSGGRPPSETSENNEDGKESSMQ